MLCARAHPAAPHASTAHIPGRRSLQAWEQRGWCTQAAAGMLDQLCRARKEDKDKEEQRGRARLQEQVGEDGDDLRVEQARRPEAGALRAAQAVRRAPDAHAHLRPLAREACGHAREAAAAAELRLPAPAAPGRASPVEAYPVRSQSKTCSQCPCLPLQLDSAHHPSRHAQHWDHLIRCACTDACAATPTQLPRPTAARMHIGARRPDKHSSGQDMHVPSCCNPATRRVMLAHPPCRCCCSIWRRWYRLSAASARLTTTVTARPRLRVARPVTISHEAAVRVGLW